MLKALLAMPLISADRITIAQWYLGAALLINISFQIKNVLLKPEMHGGLLFKLRLYHMLNMQRLASLLKYTNTYQYDNNCAEG